MGQREDVYDSEINPLMAQIIEICKRADIPMAAQFQISDHGEETSFCSTIMTASDVCSPHLRAVASRMRPPPPEWAAFVVHGDGRRVQVAGSDMPDEEA